MTEAFGPLRLNGDPLAMVAAKAAFKDRKLYAQWLAMLNHWGRLATAYYAGVLDKEVARDMHRYGFVAFMRFFESYFKASISQEHYKDTIRLFDEWKSL